MLMPQISSKPRTGPLLLTVAVCTHSRAALLKGVLRTLSEQTLSRAEFEVLVIDNASTDETSEVVETFSRGWPELRYVFESEVGLSHARNRAWKEARGRYVGYTDDDCEVPPHWLESAAEIASRVSPAAFGGPIRVLLESEPPSWFRDAYYSHEPYEDARFLDRSGFKKLYGGNLFVRRSVFNELGGFDSSRGMAGKKVSFGEETAFLIALAGRTGETAYYDPNLWVRHHVRPEKLTYLFEARRALAGGRNAYRLQTAEGGLGPAQVSLRRALRMLVGLAIDLPRGFLARDRGRYPYFRNYFQERTLQYFHRLGKLYEQIRDR